jgi:hypothetical protein
MEKVAAAPRCALRIRFELKASLIKLIIERARLRRKAERTFTSNVHGPAEPSPSKNTIRSGKANSAACDELVGATGFEPATSWSQTRRSTRLSYTPDNEQGTVGQRRAVSTPFPHPLFGANLF